MTGFRTATFVVPALFAAWAAQAQESSLTLDFQVPAIVQPAPFTVPTPRLQGLIDAVLRYERPKLLSDNMGTPRPFEPLHWIAITDDADTLERMLARGADPNAIDAEGRTPLMVAAAFDSRRVADMLLGHGADPLTRDLVDGNSALDFAAMAGHADLVRMLIATGAPVEGRARRNGETPLHYAAFYGRKRAIEALVEAGAAVNVEDRTGVRPLQYARRRLQGLAVELLLKLGARMDDLQDAVNAGDVARVGQLIARGADVDAYDLSGTPLHRAAATGQTYIATMLINAGANIEAPGEPASSRPLHIAALSNHPEMVEMLIDRGAEIEGRDAQERTPLLIAATYGNAEVADALLRRQADPHAPDMYRDAPIHYASKVGSIETVDLLLARGVDVNAKSAHDGEAPITYAAGQGEVEMVAFLIERGADVNQRDNTGRTPLQFAYDCFSGEAVVRLLTRIGAMR